MQEKAFKDIEDERGVVEKRQGSYFPSFMYD